MWIWRFCPYWTYFRFQLMKNICILNILKDLENTCLDVSFWLPVQNLDVAKVIFCFFKPNSQIGRMCLLELGGIHLLCRLFKSPSLHLPSVQKYILIWSDDEYVLDIFVKIGNQNAPSTSEAMKNQHPCRSIINTPNVPLDPMI
jgi:hypothetical protein